MARRVELDLLEIDGPAEAPGTAPAGIAAEAGPAPPKRMSLLLRLRACLQRALGVFGRPGPSLGWRALLNWKVLAAGVTGLLLLSAAAGSLVYFRHQGEERITAGQQTAAVPAAPAVHEAVFPDFSIDVKDAKGRYRFLQCDVTVEFHGAVELTEDRKVEIRRAIYHAAKKRGPEWIGKPDSGSRFKRDVREELQSVLGEGTLKNVYLTRFVWL
ncbi:MAG: flagellar basal body-associated FliL family protein [Syntrophaceae bacterium]|nr:flagellar basal body-associated FliL family protein [Syntrophaceae bacterium]